MWSIGEVKKSGWSKVSTYYWSAFLVVFLLSMVSGLGGTLHIDIRKIVGMIFGGEFFHFGHGFHSIWRAVEVFFLSLMAVSGIVGFAIKIFVVNPIEVGTCRFFMESRNLYRSAGMDRVLFGFTSGHYLNIVKTMLLRDIFITLWTFLFIIPGLVKAYEYTMIPFILSENPEAEPREVFALTKEMMYGNKFQMFLCELSFIGWYLLGILACGVGVAFVNPYERATMSEVYAVLRGKASGFHLNGFNGDDDGMGNDSYENTTYRF